MRLNDQSVCNVSGKCGLAPHFRLPPRVLMFGIFMLAQASAFDFSSAVECPLVQERTWGDGQFVHPTALTVGPGGEVYVGDGSVGTCRIYVFDGNGNLIRTWGSDGNAPGQFEGIADIAVSSDGFVYVTDVRNHRVQKFTTAGGFVKDWGGLGSGPGQFTYPHGVAIAPGGQILVTDPSNNRVEVFTPDGQFLNQWGTTGSGLGQLRDPRRIATDNFGNVFVSEYGNHRIQKFTLDGTPLLAWGSFCDTGVQDTCSGQFDHPLGLCTSPLGDVYVADEFNQRIEHFTNSGGFVCELGGYQLPDGLFWATEDVAMDTNENLFVTDQLGRVVKFVRAAVPTRLTTWGSIKAAYR